MARHPRAAADVKGTVDFGILTIREDEFAAVLERLPPQETVKGRRLYNLHRMELPEGGSYLVAVMRCVEPGNTEALDAVHDVMEDLAPRWLLVVGIAGGVPSEERSLGDVVVSTRIVDFSVEAALQGGETELALGSGAVHKDAATWVANLPAMKAALGEWSGPAAIRAERPRLVVDEAERFYGDEAWQAKTRKALARHVGRTEPHVTTGAIASSDRLVKDAKRLKVLLRAARQVVAVEMESAGALRGASGRGVPLLAIRGLSDVVGFARETEWTRYACHTAAAFTAALLRTRPIDPRSAVEPGRVDPVPEAELREYLAKAEELHRELHLAGFENAVRVTLTLEDLYVPLDAVVDHGVAGRDVYSSAFEAKAHESEDTGRGMRLPIPLADAFVEARRQNKRGLIVLGDPGSGKTTHLKQVLLKVAREGPESMGLPLDTVPVLLPLRNLRDREGGLPGLIQQELRDPMLALADDFGARMCKRGRLLFLLDGLDEVADAAERAEVARWIERARTSGPDNWFLVTCRYAGYTRDVELDASFLELHLRPLDDAQVRRFVSNWYAIVERATSRDPAKAKIQAERRTKDLLETLDRPEFSAAARVYEMTRNPLLLTAICLVHRDCGRLPRARAQLYDESLMVLLERWRTTKKLPVTLPASQAVQVLQPVALWMHEVQGRTRATTEELRGTVDAALGELRNTKLDAKAFLEAIRDESGLLTGWGIDSFGFMHLGFQEYLAAQRLRNLGVKDPAVIDALARRFDESWWREVILLMLALDNPSVFEELMRAVVEQPRFPEWARSEMMDLCLSESARVSAAPFVAVVRGDGRERSWLATARRWIGSSEGPEVAARQVAALEVLGRAMPEEVPRLGSELEGHRAKEVREWWGRWLRRGQLGAERIVAARGGVELVRIPGGRFLMGSPEDDVAGSDLEKPQHWVELEEFWFARTPVTNAQYAEYLKANPRAAKPKYWGEQKLNQSQQPVVGVSWKEAVAYCEWAGLQLPTEAQWEYACRAGTTTRYWSGDVEADLARVGWYDGNSGGRLHAVGELEPNAFGLYDMHGNAREWCKDTWVDDYEGAVHRPGDGLRTQPADNVYCVVRGGDFFFVAREARSAFRSARPPDIRDFLLGFRPAQR